MLVGAGAGVLSVGLSMSGGRWHVCEGHRSVVWGHWCVVWGILACVGNAGVLSVGTLVCCVRGTLMCVWRSLSYCGGLDVCVGVAVLLGAQMWGRCPILGGTDVCGGRCPTVGGSECRVVAVLLWGSLMSGRVAVPLWGPLIVGGLLSYYGDR